MLAAAFVLSACRGSDQVREPIRLVERLATARVERPSAPPPAAARELEPDELLASEVPGLLRLGIGPEEDRDWRLALAGPAGSKFSFRMRVPRGAVLRFAVGRLAAGADAPETPLEPASARVVLAAGESEELLWRLDLASAEARRWRPVELDLAVWRGREVELGFESQGDVASWVAFAHPEIGPPAPRRGERPPSIVLVSLDTLRADRLGAYGYRANATSPNLDRFAADATRFDWAISQAPWTRPSHRAMLTGLYPMSNGGLRSPAIGELLWRGGYRTAAMTGGGQVDPRFGFDAGFERFRVWDWVRDPGSVLDWLADDGRPYFLFLHTYEPHEPYQDGRFASGMPRGRLQEDYRKVHWKWLGASITAEEKAYASALYDGDIAFLDEALGDLFARFAEAGVLDDAVVVVTSDHGEQFWEHGTWGHGGTVYDEEIRVPLIVRLPPRLVARGGAPASVPQQVQVVDLYPTLLELLGVPLGHAVQGRSLRPLLAGEPGWVDGEALSEATSGRMERKALRTRRSKLILSARSAAWPGGDEAAVELYDLARDPDERRNLAADHEDVIAAIRARLVALAEHGGTREDELPTDIDPELAAKLRALGYLGN